MTNSDKPDDSSHAKPSSPDFDVDLAREQVPHRQHLSTNKHESGQLDLSGDIYGLHKHELLAFGGITKPLQKPMEDLPSTENNSKATEPHEEGRTRRVAGPPPPPLPSLREHEIKPGVFTPPVTYIKALSEVFGSSINELGRHHNQILDVNVPDMLKKQGIGPNEPIILCNFDTHSDMKKPPNDPKVSNAEGIGSWVNKMIADNPQITNFYWVMPDELKNNEKYNSVFFSNKDKIGNLADSPRDQTIYVNSTTKEIFWDKPKDYAAGQYRQVGIHKRTLDEMPDMKGKNVIWTTDLDGFDNKGADTVEHAKIPYQGEKGFEKYLNTMNDKHIRPFFHFIAQSEEYTSQRHMNELNRFAAEASMNSLNKGDINIANYHNTTGPELFGDLPYTGITVNRSGNPEHELLYQLFVNDARTTSPDGAIVLHKPNEEYRAAIDQAAAIVRKNEAWAKRLASSVKGAEAATSMNTRRVTPEAKATAILRYLDGKDGKTDGILDFRIIEEDIIEAARRKSK